MRKLFLFALVLGVCFSCSKDDAEKCAYKPDVANIHLNLNFESYEDSLTRVSSKKELVALLGRQPMIRDFIFRRTAYPNDSAFVNAIYQRVTSTGFDSLLIETKKVFSDQSYLKEEFTSAFKNIKYYYPDFIPPKVQTIISGLDNDLFVSDSLIIVSLDFYLGSGARYRPNMYEYILRQYVKENIVPSCMLIFGINDRLNKTDLKDNSVLADMIAYGKAYYFAKHMIPCVADSTLTWYTAEEIDGARKNEDLIWARFIEDKVLYASSHVIKQRYLGERPKTLEVGEKCPGRIGRWVGWRIVNAYMQAHPETTLPQLMALSDAQQIFKASKYKPGS